MVFKKIDDFFRCKLTNVGSGHNLESNQPLRPIIVSNRRALPNDYLMIRWQRWKGGTLSSPLPARVRILKPVVTYDIVTFDKKAVCPDLFATLPNVFHHINFTIYIKHCRCNFWSGNTIFEIQTYWKVVLNIRKLYYKFISK
jgi:hypothetical protein